jgi:hypothetical protein
MKKLQLFVDKHLSLSSIQKKRRQTLLQYKLNALPTSPHLPIWEYTQIEDGCTTAKAQKPMTLAWRATALMIGP